MSAPIPARVSGTGLSVRGPLLSTEALAARLAACAAPGARTLSPEEAIARTGIRSRRWAPLGTPIAELAAEALGGALSDAGLVSTDLRRVIFVSSTGGDHLIPANANHVLARLGVGRGADAFDLNNACTGFLTALDLAARTVATGGGPVGVVAAECFSPHIGPDDPRPYLVMGDAAAAAIVEPARADEGLLAIHLFNDGDHAKDIEMGHPTATGEAARLRFLCDNRHIGRTAMEAVRTAAEAVAAASGLALADAGHVVPHQPNGTLLDAIVEDLGLDPERVHRVVETLGSLGAASIAASLHTLKHSGRAQAGDTVLFLAVGAGLSAGAALLRWGG